MKRINNALNYNNAVNYRPAFITALLIAALCLLPSISAAQSQKTDIRPNAERLLSEALLKAFKGVTHDGAYNFNLEGFAGAHYRETHKADSRVTYSEAGEKYEGVWRIHKDMMCYTYAGNSLSGGCFRVYQIKNCYYFYSSTFIERENELDRDYWTARSVKKGEEPLCIAAMS